MASQWLTIAVFGLVYLGIALGRWPGLAIDRTGIALIGAIVLFVGGAVDGAMAAGAIDFTMLAVLFALMVLSAQFAASGFFEWAAGLIAATQASPVRILAITVFVAGGLSAVLTNDVIVWAMTPVLVRGLQSRGLDPAPYVIALAMAANAGSAATIIGNPQNLLIGSFGGLGFWPFFIACGVPAAASLGIVFGVIAWARRTSLLPLDAVAVRPPPPPAPERAALAKGTIATLAIIAVFTLPVERAPWALAVAGALLLSRRLTTARMLSMVDWHLLVLFAALFVVTGALSAIGLPERVFATAGVEAAPETIALAAVLGSNTIGNVPLVMLALSSGLGLVTQELYALALFSTLAGNLLVVGSLANVIAIERAKGEGIHIGFGAYARLGVPVTLLSIAAAWAWLHYGLPILAGNP